MPDLIQEQLKTVGVAHVIVELKPLTSRSASGRESLALAGAGGGGTSLGISATSLERHFVSSELSQESFLLRAAARKATGGGAGGGGRRGRAALHAESLEAAVASAPTPPKMRVYPNLGLMFGTVDRAGLKALRDDDSVAAVSGAPPISLIRPVSAKAATLSGSVTWGLKRLGITQLWDSGLTGAGILVGHLDTGVNGKHPALKSAIGEFAEFDLLGNLVPNAKAHDTDQHGTHTAGTIAGRKVTSTAFGVAPGETRQRHRHRGGSGHRAHPGGNGLGRRPSSPNPEHVAGIARVPRGFPALGPDLALEMSSRSSPWETRDRGRAGHPAIMSKSFRSGPVTRATWFPTSHRASNSSNPVNCSCPTSSRRGWGSSRAYRVADLPRWTAPRWPRRISPGSRPCYSKRSRRRRPIRSRRRSSVPANSRRPWPWNARTVGFPTDPVLWVY